MSLASIRIAIKLPSVIIALCLTTGIAISSLAYIESKNTLLEQTKLRLDILVESRAEQIQIWSESMLHIVAEYGTNSSVLDAVKSFSGAYGRLGESPYQFYDVFLFNTEGDLIYSVFKEADFATNFVDGPYDDSGLGEVYRKALSAEPGQVISQDFAPYAPSAGAPAAFVATPVANNSGEVIGVFAIQLPIGVMTDIARNSLGLGDTGDIRVVSGDGSARSVSRFENGAAILEPLVGAEEMGQLLEGKAFDVGQIGWSGQPVISVINELGFLDSNWFLIAQFDKSEALEAANELRNMMTLGGSIILVLAGVVGLLFARMVTVPLTRLNTAMNGVAGRIPNVEVQDTDRGDEIGMIAKTLVEFRDKLDQSDQLEAEASKGHKEQSNIVKELGTALKRRERRCQSKRTDRWSCRGCNEGYQRIVASNL